ncbi:ArsA family ATPase [Streptomyces sp. KR80]|uniref:ArsA family ATPase n=1 Tax=Streptomyces sp. KR80 TaxID=3457426 RepID=UPI003FD5AC1A
MRTVLVTGAGGAGRTTVAAATALAAARRGRRVLLLTTDRLATPGAMPGIPGLARRAADAAGPPPASGEETSAAAMHAAAAEAPAPVQTAASGSASGLPSAPVGSQAQREASDAARPVPWTVPVQAAPGLWAARLDAGEHVRTELLALQERSSAVLDLLGATPLDREEITELPGAPQLALIRALQALHDLATITDRPEGAAVGHGASAGTGPTGLPAAGGAARAGWDLVVVDMQPVPEALAVLGLPEELRRCLRRLLPPERQAARALRPLLAQFAGVPAPAQWLYDMTDRLDRELAAAQAVLDSHATTLRVVVEPGPAGSETLRAARVGAALYGLPIDAVVANKVLPTGSTDPWLAALSGRQQTAVKTLHDEVATAHAVCELPHLGHQAYGLDDLAELIGRAESTRLGDGGGDGGGDRNGTVGPAERDALADGLADGLDRPDGPRDDPRRVEDRRADEGMLVWRIPLPGAERGEVDLVRRGDELVLGVGPFRRILPLPSALRRCSVAGASLADGELKIRFVPDPGLWPRPSTPPSEPSGA